MKNSPQNQHIIFNTLFIGLTLLYSSTSFAAADHADGSCIKLMEACKAAGYNKSILSENKSLSKNCLQPLLNGEKVEGVTVDPKDVEACKVKKTEIKSSN